MSYILGRQKRSSYAHLMHENPHETNKLHYKPSRKKNNR